VLSQEQREKAGEISLALSWGYAELDEAVLWADSIIENADLIHDTIFSVSLAKNASSAIDSLNDLSEGASEWRILKRFLKRFQTVKSLPVAQALKLAEELYYRSIRDNAPNQFSCFHNHWDIIGLARDGHIKAEPDTATKEFLDDIRKCADSDWTYDEVTTKKAPIEAVQSSNEFQRPVILNTQKLDRPTNCIHCGDNGGFNYGHAKNDEGSIRHSAFLSLKKYKPLRFGSLYKCTNCDSYWYYNPDRDWMGYTPDSRLALILNWNESKISLSGKYKKILKSIGMTPSDIYGNGRQYKEFPCRIVTAGGEVTDFGIVSLQKHPPYEPHRKYCLASEVVELSESWYALPLDVRVATSRARERNMGYAPTLIESNGKQFTLNWTTNFFSKEGHNASDVQISSETRHMNAMPIIAKSAVDITYFIADPVEF